MKMTLAKIQAAALAAALAAFGSAANAQDGVKIGMLTDLSGPSSALSGEGSIKAIQLAIDDFGGTVLGKPIELVSGDHLGKPDVGLSIARQWLDTENVDVIVDVNNSAVALAVNELTREKKKIFLAGGSTTDMVGKACNPYTSQWIPDSTSLIRSIVLPVVKSGGTDWFFLTVDYAFGHSLEGVAIKTVEENGGKVLGKVRHSPSTTDYSSFLLEAKSSGAKQLGMLTFGSFMVNIIKQVNEFGMDFTLVPAYMSEVDIAVIGQDNLKNVQGATPFYWNRNEATRAWAMHYKDKYGVLPTFAHAQHYSAVTHYLQAVEAAGSKDPELVAAKMREMPINDATDTSAYIREDGRVMRDMYSFRVKSVAETKEPGDVMEIIATADKEEINFPLSESECPLIKK